MFLFEIVLFVLVGIVVIVGCFLIFSRMNMYRPDRIIDLIPSSIPADPPGYVLKNLSILTWNIGYGGIDRAEDFFMSGGKMSMPANKNIVKNNMNEIMNFLRSHKTDFIILQEVDESATRSYKINEVKEIYDIFSDYESFFALNYKVAFVPVPLACPLGSVRSGLMTVSKYIPLEAKRYAFPGDLSWPNRLFELKRCFVVTKYMVEKSSKMFDLVNLHLSAFDRDGKLRKIELDYLKDFMIKEYKTGNYVVVGGDWNSIMLGVRKVNFHFTTSQKYLKFYVNLPDNWTPIGWKWAFDEKVPTNRSNEKPYIRGENFITIIDGFLLSPNVDLVAVKGFDLEFKNSDHNPVKIDLALK